MKIWNTIESWLSHFIKKDPQKPADAWPFPAVSEDFEPREKCCGGCNKPAKKPAKSLPVKKPKAKKTEKKPAVKKAKK